MSNVVECDIVDAIADVRLNRPEKRNAINDAMFDELLAVATRLAGDASVRAVVLSGVGHGFCAGLDFDQFRAFAAEGEAGEKPFADPGDPAAGGRRIPGRGQRIVSALRAADVPVVAAVHGAAIGGGLQLTLGADLRFVTADAKLGLREIEFGITPDMGGTQLLPRLVGSDVAMDLILSGRLLSGTEAVAAGLATRVCADPRAEAFAFARMVAGRNPLAVRGVTSLLRTSLTATVEEGMAAELRVMAANIGTPDQAEATRVYFERRAPVFRA
ncbi:conserved hypothetical protein [Frankia canadensis]|uniref:Enoyl-CoA hydratase/isomerase domain-containing protein n=1 Tax=Frankia canadensis TaxID=1836972 RepID=A0A2I2KKT6_9ACTN|nr:enoyl-CoA hydratase-related protein [Frankia canadensis]SNQ46257.1 conserved hypothetical protein [Frankia canadensis]SOU53547.1 conserved hypothetical protein [Frankia canadensis]